MILETVAIAQELGCKAVYSSKIHENLCDVDCRENPSWSK